MAIEFIADDDDELDDGEDYDGSDGPRYRRVACCRCGQLTTFDPVYEDLCGSCCRVENE